MEIVQRKLKVLFVCSGNSKYEDGIIPFIKSQGDSLIQKGVDLKYYPVKGKGIRGYLKNIRPLKKEIKKNKYNIIHAHYGLIGLLCLLTFSSKKVVLSVMGDDAYGTIGNNGKRALTSYIIMVLTQVSLIFMDAIIVKSRNILEWIPYKKKAFIIPNGVNFEVFKPTSDNLATNKVLFLADTNDERKNFRLLEEALKLIEDDIKLISPYPIRHNEFPGYLNDCSVFVLTSFAEGSPNVVKEAMACNIPIVSTDVGDVKEIIGKTDGCYISNFTPSDLSEKIKLALQFNKRTQGRKDMEHLESGKVAKKIIDIYNKVIQ
jgi:glycosyltransferase involved in cell wall biosynthesis